MSDSQCGCKHHNKTSDKDACHKHSAVLGTVFSSLLPHFFCCFMPAIFTAILGGTVAVFFHDYWYIVSAVAAVTVSLLFIIFKAEPFSFLRFGGNVCAAMLVALLFNVFLHPSHEGHSAYAADEPSLVLAHLEPAGGHDHHHDHAHE